MRARQTELHRDSIELELANGTRENISLAEVVKAWQPNAMGPGTKIAHSVEVLGSFLTEDPRETTTEGGIFPAIFGTVMMVLLMSVLVTPFGVIAAVYLREYAHQGPFVRLIRIPRSLREGSLALGATKAEKLFKVILPVAIPSILTGVIPAVARAAGEVAPLMLVGVVKLAPTLPMDGNFPYLHLERKFMHLGFHIYDVGFQNPDVEAARPLVYATALLLVLIIVVLNPTATMLRSRLENRCRGVDA